LRQAPRQVSEGGILVEVRADHGGDVAVRDRAGQAVRAQEHQVAWLKLPGDGLGLELDRLAEGSRERVPQM
jgi:hypothetical protein